MQVPRSRNESRFLRHVNNEQRKRILEHKWIESEKCGYDIGETAVFGWIETYAESFRAWADSIPFHCFECGFCDSSCHGTDCSFPFESTRLETWKSRKRIKSDNHN